MIRVVVVDDSPSIQQLLVHILESDPQIEVVGVASNGLEALSAVQRYRPDLVTMDIHMPKMDGFEATRQIMENFPTPIVVVSGSHEVGEVSFSFRALEAGALAVMDRPPGLTHPDHPRAVAELIKMIKLMSEVKVVTRKPRYLKNQAPPIPVAPVPTVSRDISLVAIGASTGGPMVLQRILSQLPLNPPYALLIVQHITEGFIGGFVDWLSEATGFPMVIAQHGQLIEPGVAYMAPDGYHLGVQPGPRVVLSNHAPENHLRPSIAHLFRSVAESFGSLAAGVLLTGMGSDGAAELRLLRERGAITIAQDQESSMIFGMPGAAVALGAAMHVLPPDAIVTLLAQLARKPQRSPK